MKPVVDFDDAIQFLESEWSNKCKEVDDLKDELSAAKEDVEYFRDQIIDLKEELERLKNLVKEEDK